MDPWPGTWPNMSDRIGWGQQISKTSWKNYSSMLGLMLPHVSWGPGFCGVNTEQHGYLPIILLKFGRLITRICCLYESCNKEYHLMHACQVASLDTVPLMNELPPESAIDKQCLLATNSEQNVQNLNQWMIRCSQTDRAFGAGNTKSYVFITALLSDHMKK